MFLINYLTQHRKFAELFLLPVYRVCIQNLVIDCFWLRTQFLRFLLKIFQHH